MSVAIKFSPDFTVHEEVNRGGFSSLYRITRNEQEYILKIIRAVGSSESVSQDTMKRFFREGTALARFRHPALVRIFDMGVFDGKPFLIMEYAKGQNLAELLRKNGKLQQDLVVLIGQTLSSALMEVHRYGLVHRDIKPQNVILESGSNQQNNIKLVDFGFVSPAELRPDSSQLLGSFLYASPEQAGMFQRPVDARSDLYSLGVMLYECVAGIPPFRSNDLGELLQDHAIKPVKPLIESDASIDPRLSSIISRCLNKDPDDRYQTAEALYSDFRVLSNHLQLTTPANLESQPTDLKLIGAPEEQHSFDRRYDNGVYGVSLAQGFNCQGEPLTLHF